MPRSQILLRCVCVTGLRRFGIRDPSPPKALFTRVLKVSTYRHFAIYFCLPTCLLPPSKLSPNIKRFFPVPQTFIAWLLSRLAQVLLVRQRRSSPPNPGLPLRRSVLTVPLHSWFDLSHGSALPARGRLAPPAPPCLPGASAPSVEAPAPAHDGREGAGLLAASGRGALSHLSPP